MTMKSLKVLSFVFVMFLVGAVYVPSTPSYAKDGQQAEECTSKDKKKIASFNKKIERKKKERKELQEDADKVTGIGGSMKYQRKLKEIDDFFDSAEYYNMQAVYQRCGMRMPR